MRNLGQHLIALGVAMMLGGAVASGAPASVDPRTSRLIDQDGAPFRLRDLAGKPTLVTFVATRCTDTCPIADAVFDALAKRLRRDRIDARLLTVTLDPAYDTPYVFAAEARRFNADARVWRFASGNVSDVHRLMASLGVSVAPDKRGIPEMHSTFAFVLDRDVRLERTLLISPGLANTGERVLRDAARRR